MSAYIVDTRLIDALLTYGLEQVEFKPLTWLWPAQAPTSTYERGVAIPEASVIVAQERRASLTMDTVNRIGQVLLAENVRSVNHRYDEQRGGESYHFTRFPYVVRVANLLGLIDCLAYQSCEHPEWEESEAHAILQALKGAAIHQLPGYAWTWPGEAT